MNRTCRISRAKALAAKVADRYAVAGDSRKIAILAAREYADRAITCYGAIMRSLEPHYPAAHSLAKNVKAT